MAITNNNVKEFKKVNIDSNAKKKLEDYAMSFLPQIKEIIQMLGVDEKYYDDLTQAGLLGVIEAFRNHDIKNSAFYIESEIIKTLKSIPYYSGFDFGSILSELASSDSNNLSGESIEYLDIEPTSYIEDLSDDYALPTEEVPFKSPISTSYENETEKGALELADYETVITYLGLLDKRTQFIIINTLGLFGNTPKTEEQIGNMLGITGVRVRQIYHKGISKIKIMTWEPDCVMRESVDFYKKTMYK